MEFSIFFFFLLFWFVPLVSLFFSLLDVATFHIGTAYTQTSVIWLAKLSHNRHTANNKQQKSLRALYCHTINVFYSQQKLILFLTFAFSLAPNSFRKHIVFVYLLNGFNLFILTVLLFRSAARRHTLCARIILSMFLTLYIFYFTPWSAIFAIDKYFLWHSLYDEFICWLQRTPFQLRIESNTQYNQ